MKRSSIRLRLLALLVGWASAYDLLIDNRAGPHTFYQEITDGSTGGWIGEMYQDSIFDPVGRFLGINQGYSFNFDNGTSYNINNIMFLGEGQEIYWFNDAIVSATGTYERYQGGTLELNVLQANPDFVAEITLVESPPPDEADEDDSDSTEKLRITSEGGFYFPILSGSGGEQIGQMFQNPITEPESDAPNRTVGINQGYSFLFPEDPFITDLLGYSSPELVLGNRRFMFDGGEFTVFNEQVIHATESYRKYTGATLSEKILSVDPQYVADITLAVPSPPPSSGEPKHEGNASFRITSDGGFYDPILDSDGTQIGERFQNPVFNSSKVRIGTNEGYGFNFPVTNLTRPLAQGNRLFYLEGGTLDVLNEVIVAASGIYSRYAGGRFDETIVSYNPIFVSDITLVPSTMHNGDFDDGSNENGTEISTSGAVGVCRKNAKVLSSIFVCSMVLGLL